MTTKAAGATLTKQPEYSSAVEKKIGESLERKISRPWSVKYCGEPWGTDTAGHGHYTPDFVITNEETGQVLAVEVRSRLSLSLPNVLKLQHIQSTLKKSGVDFFLVVHHGDSSDRAWADARLGEYGINAIGISDAIDAAAEIEKQLATYS